MIDNRPNEPKKKRGWKYALVAAATAALTTVTESAVIGQTFASLIAKLLGI